MTRRMTLVVLAIVGLMVLVVTVSPPQSPVRGGAQSTATPGSGSAPLSDPDAFDVSARLSADVTAKPQTIVAELGDRVEIVVEGSTPSSVALGEVQTRVLEQGLPARFQLLAETTGAYPLVLVDEARRIGTLEIR
jgi:hypothetical protein